VALLMCLASTFIITPKVQEIGRASMPHRESAPDTRTGLAYNKAHGLSRNLSSCAFCWRWVWRPP